MLGFQHAKISSLWLNNLVTPNIHYISIYHGLHIDIQRNILGLLFQCAIIDYVYVNCIKVSFNMFGRKDAHGMSTKSVPWKAAQYIC